MIRQVSAENLAHAERAVTLMNVIALGSGRGRVFQDQALDRVDDAAEGLLDDLGPESSSENLIKEIRDYPYVCWQADGTAIRTSDLPPSSEGLTRAQARAVFEGFKERISRNLTSGRNFAHFEQYVLYALGRSNSLSDTQKDLTLWLCTAMRRRPLPGLWSARFVFENISNPKMVRRVLSANMWSQEQYQKRFVEAFTVPSEWRRFVIPPDEQIRVLAVGYSDSITLMIQKVAETVAHKIIAYVPGLRELEQEQTAGDFYRERLQSTKVDIREITSGDVAGLVSKYKIDLVFMSSKIISATACKTTRIVESAACVKIIERIRDVCTELKKALPPVLVASAIFKIWPSNHYNQYFSDRETNVEKLKPTDDAVLSGNKVSSIVTDIGYVPPQDLSRLPNIQYRLQTDNFAAATALHMYQAAIGYLIDSVRDPVRTDKSATGNLKYSLWVGSNKYPLATERDCIILRTIRDEDKKRYAHDEKIRRHQDQHWREPNFSVFEQQVKDAKAYFDELLADDVWYHGHQEKYVAVSAHPKKQWIVADDLDSLSMQPGYSDLGVWYQCRIDRDRERRTVHISPRTRLLVDK